MTTVQSGETIVLGPTSYGKSAVRLLKVSREANGHYIHDLSIDISLEGDFTAAYTGDDNQALLATDTMRNVVYALAKQHPLDSIEAFALVLARHFLAAGPTVERARVRVSEYPWHRIQSLGVAHPHSFVRDAGEHTALVVVGANELEITAGVDNLLILKTTASGWQNFHRDEYTTLPDSDERILATMLTASWSYGARHDLDFTGLWAPIRDRILETFTDHYSPSVQNTLYRMGRAVLESFPEVQRVRLTLPNKHHLLVDLAPFGLENRNEIFHVTSEPYGLIEGVVERRA